MLNLREVIIDEWGDDMAQKGAMSMTLFELRLILSLFPCLFLTVVYNALRDFLP